MSGGEEVTEQDRGTPELYIHDVLPGWVWCRLHCRSPPERRRRSRGPRHNPECGSMHSQWEERAGAWARGEEQRREEHWRALMRNNWKRSHDSPKTEVMGNSIWFFRGIYSWHENMLCSVLFTVDKYHQNKLHERRGEERRGEERRGDSLWVWRQWAWGSSPQWKPQWKPCLGCPWHSWTSETDHGAGKSQIWTGEISGDL